MSIKQPFSWTVHYQAKRLLTQLAKAAAKRKGVYAFNVTVPGGVERQAAARMLREMGLPIVARRAGSDSIWWLLTKESSTRLQEEWMTRILHDFYSEVCRAHMALSPHAWSQEKAKALKQVAIMVGGWLGEDPLAVLADIEPSPLTETLKEVMATLDGNPS